MIALAIKKPQGFSTVHTGKCTYPLGSRLISSNLVIQSFEMQFVVFAMFNQPGAIEAIQE